MDVVFSFSSLDGAEQFDSSWVNAQDLCGLKGSGVVGNVGPFGLLTLASEHLEEFTPVFFRIFKANDQNKHKVLMCSDARRFVILFIISFLMDQYCDYIFNFFCFGILIISPRYNDILKGWESRNNIQKIYFKQ